MTSPAFRSPIRATTDESTGTGIEEWSACPKNSEGIWTVGWVVGVVVGAVVGDVVGDVVGMVVVGVVVMIVVTGVVVGTVVCVWVGVGVGTTTVIKAYLMREWNPSLSILSS